MDLLVLKLADEELRIEIQSCQPQLPVMITGRDL